MLRHVEHLDEQVQQLLPDQQAQIPVMFSREYEEGVPRLTAVKNGLLLNWAIIPPPEALSVLRNCLAMSCFDATPPSVDETIGTGRCDPSPLCIPRSVLTKRTQAIESCELSFCMLVGLCRFGPKRLRQWRCASK